MIFRGHWFCTDASDFDYSYSSLVSPPRIPDPLVVYSKPRSLVASYLGSGYWISNLYLSRLVPCVRYLYRYYAIPIDARIQVVRATIIPERFCTEFSYHQNAQCIWWSITHVQNVYSWVFHQELVRQWNLGQYVISAEFMLYMQIVAVLGADALREDKWGDSHNDRFKIHNHFVPVSIDLASTISCFRKGCCQCKCVAHYLKA